MAPSPLSHLPPCLQVPVYFVWVQKTSYLSYAFSALVEREFVKVTFYDPATGQRVSKLLLVARAVRRFFRGRASHAQPALRLYAASLRPTLLQDCASTSSASRPSWTRAPARRRTWKPSHRSVFNT